MVRLVIESVIHTYTQVKEESRVRIVKMLEAKIADRTKVEHFLNNNAEINRRQLIEKGFVVEMDNAIKGCFVIEHVNDDTYWLKQLYMNQEEIISLPLLIEAIIQQAKKLEIKTMYVHSHQHIVDQLLEALQFYPQRSPEFVDKNRDAKGKWWAYAIK